MRIQNSKFKIQKFNLKFKTFNFLLAILTFNFLLLTLPIPVFAQADSLGKARIDPASPFYFLKGVKEVLELKFAGTTNVQVYRQLEFATRRIREVKSLVNTSHEDLIEPTLARYLSHLQDLKGIANLSDKTMSAKISQSVALHMNTLQTVYQQVSDPRARMSIRATIQRLSQWDQWLIDKLNPQQAPNNVSAQTVSTSKLIGCHFLAKEASSSALNQVEKAVFAERAQKCLDKLYLVK